MIVSRYGIRGGRVSTSSLNWLAIRSSTERRCSSPSAAQHGLVGRRVVLDDQRRVLGDHLVQHVGDPLLVAASLGRDREPVHRHRELERPHVDMVLVVRIVQHAVELDLVDLRDRGDVARNGAVDLDVLAALQHEQVADLERLAAVADEELRVARDRALVDAEDAQLADERIDDDLEHVREHVLRRDRAPSGTRRRRRPRP